MTEENMNRPTFITGSRVYGAPRPDSDIDVGMLMSDKDANFLNHFSDEPIEPTKIYSDDVDINFLFGKLNIIACYSELVFDAWKKGTDKLIEESRAAGPRTRER